MTTIAESSPSPLRQPRPDRDVFANVTPNWFASVMGTGIVAISAAALPVAFPGRQAVAATFWLLALAMLVALLCATAVHWHRHPDRARRHHVHPVFSHFYGAVPMAIMTVGTGGVVAGHQMIGIAAALGLDWTLWTIGTIGGLATMIAIPSLLRAGRIAGEPFAGRLMAVVPPVVSASAGAQLATHATGEVRTNTVIASFAVLFVGLTASTVTVVPVVRQLYRHGPGTPALVPTVWILLGPLGQSITAANAIGRLAGHDGRTAGLVYSALAGPVAVVVFSLAVWITARQAVRQLPFALTWWSFTFPVGTCVTAASGLATITGNPVLRAVAVALFGALVLAWFVVAPRTARGIRTGDLLRA